MYYHRSITSRHIHGKYSQIIPNLSFWMSVTHFPMSIVYYHPVPKHLQVTTRSPSQKAWFSRLQDSWGSMASWRHTQSPRDFLLVETHGKKHHVMSGAMFHSLEAMNHETDDWLSTIIINHCSPTMVFINDYGVGLPTKTVISSH